MSVIVLRGQAILPHEIVRSSVVVKDGRIIEVTAADREYPSNVTVIDVEDGYISPGFIDLHVHGGAGADFMDGTADAFRTALRCHLRHGTTRMAVTTTVGTHEQIIAVLEQARCFRRQPDPLGSRVLGTHFYGPYFRYEARGAHPGGPVRPPVASEFLQYLAYHEDLVTATLAPEVPGAKQFALACRAHGVRTNVGHSWATFSQMSEAVRWGVRHVDHLFCAMSDKAKLRQFQMYPMQGGVLEATLFFDELTTEVISDGKHLDAGLLKLALKIKGPDRLAIVTDSNRALDMPDGPSSLGPLEGGEPLIKRDGVGMTMDGKALASSVQGMDHMVRTFWRLTNASVWDVIRMASLTPAEIAGVDHETGSISSGKRADLLILSPRLEVLRVLIDGSEVTMDR
ncbi:MAG: N-acetylglucosamine-6-phosphate deacetylase [Planctomyces sp.]|nr:N-acetylglucosamine-6-phosphate deacetylase [Planctomyces sp.]